MSSSLCFSTFVFGEYQDYIPFYVSSILYHYPHHSVRIFIYDHLRKHVENSLVFISGNLSTRFSWHMVYPWLRDPAMRFLLKGTDFQCEEFAYIGDVDFIIVKEPIDILDFHLDHSKSIGLPYSNLIRPDSPCKLSGLHFVHTKPYFKLVDGEIDKTCARLKNRTRLSYGEDELILFNLVKKAIGLPLITSKSDFCRFRPHHGFHLGLLRIGKSPWNYEYSEEWKEYKRLSQGYFKSGLFAALMTFVKNPCIRGQLNTLKDFVLFG